MPELNDILASLTELNPKADAFADALKSKAQPLFQAVFDRGHSAATKELKQKVKDAETERDAEKERADGLSTQLEEARKGQPDLKKVQDDHKAVVDDLKAQLRDAKKQAAADLKAARLESHRARFRSLLNNLDPEYADVKAEKLAARIDLDSEGNVVVMQEGKQIPIHADDPLKALADEVTSKAPAKFVLSNADNGSGTQNAGGGNTDKAFYDGIREGVKKTQEPAKTEARRDVFSVLPSIGG